MSKAYISLLRKTTVVGVFLGKFALALPTSRYLKTLKFAFPPMRNPNASQWNIGCVGSPRFDVVYSFSSVLGTQRERCSQWNMGLNVNCIILSNIFQSQ